MRKTKMFSYTGIFMKFNFWRKTAINEDNNYNIVSPLVSQLSQNILSGLHEISRCVASQNYQRGLEVHTQVVSSSNFSEISAFMPILKVVMTIANKLGV